jgi:hypothetical protein
VTTIQIKETHMQVSKRSGVVLLAIAALAGSATTAISALGSGDGGRSPVLRSPLVSSDPGAPVLHTVAPGSVPWTLHSGTVRLTSNGDGNGDLRVRIKGLQITGTGGPLDGTIGPVTWVDAALYCGDNTTAFATTATVALSKKGNARIDTTIPLPGKCLTPAILINPLGNARAYIAATGIGG